MPTILGRFTGGRADGMTQVLPCSEPPSEFAFSMGEPVPLPDGGVYQPPFTGGMRYRLASVTAADEVDVLVCYFEPADETQG